MRIITTMYRAKLIYDSTEPTGKKIELIDRVGEPQEEALEETDIIVLANRVSEYNQRQQSLVKTIHNVGDGNFTFNLQTVVE